MPESDIPTWVLTGALVGVTVLVWRATSKVAKATKNVAEVTKETTKLPIMPRILIVDHHKLPDSPQDHEHDHYNFIFQNLGVGNAFDLKIESFHKEGSAVDSSVNSLGINASTSIVFRSIDKDAKEVKFKISYRDYADNPYQRDFFYVFESKTERRI